MSQLTKGPHKERERAPQVPPKRSCTKVGDGCTLAPSCAEHQNPSLEQQLHNPRKGGGAGRGAPARLASLSGGAVVCPGWCSESDGAAKSHGDWLLGALLGVGRSMDRRSSAAAFGGLGESLQCAVNAIPVGHGAAASVVALHH